jgi:DNA replication protein DnaC
MNHEFTISSSDLKLKMPFGCLISGPSSSGKSQLCRRLVEAKEAIFEPSPQSTLYCYGQFSPLVTHFESLGILTMQGVPSDQFLHNLSKPALLVLDDLMYDIDEKWLNAMYTKRSHHQNISIIMLFPNLFERKLKVARLNSMYLILMRAPNSILSIGI